MRAEQEQTRARRMKTQFEFLWELISALDRAGISHMITGSLASTYYGRPRTTQDVDLVIESEQSQLRGFVDAARSQGYYADPDDALTHRSMFNIIDPESVSMAAPEDAILSKLEWARESRSELQFMDALGILLIEKESLDFAYLEPWASSLGLSADLSRLLSRGDGLSEPKGYSPGGPRAA
jgi:hypothetical protein